MNKKLLSLLTLIVLVFTMLPATIAVAAPPAQAAGKVYTIQKDDWLSKIAEKEYGNIMAYPAIVHYNNLKAKEDKTFTTIDNPDVLEVGWTVYLPTPDEVAVYMRQTPAETQRLILATTTSTADSGLLGYVLPEFEKASNCRVDVIAVGSGQAMEIGSKGDADVLLVHSRKSEDQFVADGHAKERFDVMYNDFIIVGPTDDPAKIGGMTMAKDAFKAIMDAQAPFASRGDKSGTHTKELSVWASLSITPTQEMTWYNSLGQGMGDTLLFSNEKKAYTLADRGTYLSMKDKLPGLTVLVGGNNLAENKDKVLLNPYGLMAVNPEKHPNVNYELAMKFVKWMVSPETQKVIGGYGLDKFGQPLFYPSSEEYKASLSAGAPPAAAGKVALKITGKVAKEMGWAEEEVRAMKTMEAQSTNKQGQTETYTGASLNQLLELAGVQTGATTLVFVGDDGYTAEVALAEVQACKDCIVSFREQGGFSTVLPGFPGKVQVKGVIEIQVK